MRNFECGGKKGKNEKIVEGIPIGRGKDPSRVTFFFFHSEQKLESELYVNFFDSGRKQNPKTFLIFF